MPNSFAPNGTFATWPGPASSASLTSWIRELGILSECLVSPPPFPIDAVRGRGEAVIIMPGFCSPNISTSRLRQFLSHQGFSPEPWELGVNIGPTPLTMSGLTTQLKSRATERGPLALVGISLGGVIAREMAKRHPELVTRVITLASPIRLPVPTPLAPLAQLCSLLWEESARASFDRVVEPPPVPVTAVITTDDGLVDWRSCLPPSAPNVEVVHVRGAHCTIASNPDVQRIVVARLAERPVD